MYPGSDVRIVKAFPTLLIAGALVAGAFVAVPGSARAGGPVGGCLCCWDRIDNWPFEEHIADDDPKDNCDFLDGEWVDWGHGTHDDWEQGSCQNGDYHGSCGGGGENLTLAMEMARTGDAEDLVQMLGDEGGYVRMALDGTGIQVLSCDLERIAAWGADHGCCCDTRREQGGHPEREACLGGRVGRTVVAEATTRRRRPVLCSRSGRADVSGFCMRVESMSNRGETRVCE